MFTALRALKREYLLAVITAVGVASHVGFSAGKDGPYAPSVAATARRAVGPAAVVPLAEQPPAKIIVDDPLPDELRKGNVVIQFRTENLRISPVFGLAALAISPRIGHLHVYVDDLPWLLAHVSDDEVNIKGLPAGPHKVRIDLVNSNHQPIGQEVVTFDIPPQAVVEREHAAGTERSDDVAPAKLVVESPEPGLLAHGVAYLRFRTEGVRIAPVFGSAALAVSPRVGHLQVSVDDAPWYWTDASAEPVDVGGLPSGKHRIRITLVDAIGGHLAEQVIVADVP